MIKRILSAVLSICMIAMLSAAAYAGNGAIIGEWAPVGSTNTGSSSTTKDPQPSTGSGETQDPTYDNSTSDPSSGTENESSSGIPTGGQVFIGGGVYYDNDYSDVIIDDEDGSVVLDIEMPVEALIGEIE